MKTSKTTVENPLTGKPLVVTGVSVQLWATIEDNQWVVTCPNLDGVAGTSGSFDDAVGWCVHWLCAKVNEHKNAHTRIPWVDLGDRQPPSPDTIVIRKGIS